jgi:WD40 repeat protein
VISFSGPTGTAFFGEVSGDHRWLVSSKIFSRTITLWDVARRKEIRDFPEMTGWPQSVRFSKDLSRVAARCSAGEILIWDRQSGRQIERIESSDLSLDEVVDRESESPHPAEAANELKSGVAPWGGGEVGPAEHGSPGHPNPGREGRVGTRNRATK